MTRKISTIGFDADDTLWQNETFFRITQDRFTDLLRDFTEPDHLQARLLEAEIRNNGRYGFGVKGFVLSMIETAIEVTDAKVSAGVIQELIEAGQDLLAHPIHLLPHVEETLSALSEDHQILLVTKGDLLDQERKMAQSTLGDYFDGIEIVSHKNPATYKEVLHRNQVNPSAFMMVGNSMKSDILPVLSVGGWAVFVPHDLTWELEHAAHPENNNRFAEIQDLSSLNSALTRFNQF